MNIPEYEIYHEHKNHADSLFLERPSRNGASFSKELLQKRLYKRNQVLNANSPFVITDETLEHHYHAFQEPWGEGEKVILQKEDIMQYSKEEIK